MLNDWGFLKPARKNWLLSKSRPITYNAESSNWPALGFLQLVFCSKLQHLWISPTYGFLKDIFAGLHCNHGQGFLLSQRHHQLTEWIWFYSTMEGIAPSRCKHMTRPLGATHCCSRLHHQIYKVPAHYCIMTRPLGATSYDVLFSKEKNVEVPSRRKQSTCHLGATLFRS